MNIPPEHLDTISLFYRGVTELAVELVMECHDPDYETTLARVRRRISEAEERTFQLTLFDQEGVGLGAVSGEAGS